MENSFKIGDKVFFVEEIHYKELDEFRYRIKKGTINGINKHQHGVFYELSSGTAKEGHIFYRHHDCISLLRKIFDEYCSDIWKEIKEVR